MAQYYDSAIYLVGAGAMSRGTALFTSTTLPSIVCSVFTTMSAAACWTNLMFYEHHQ